MDITSSVNWSSLVANILTIIGIVSGALEYWRRVWKAKTFVKLTKRELSTVNQRPFESNAAYRERCNNTHDRVQSWGATLISGYDQRELLCDFYYVTRSFSFSAWRTFFCKKTAEFCGLYQTSTSSIDIDPEFGGVSEMIVNAQRTQGRDHANTRTEEIPEGLVEMASKQTRDCEDIKVLREISENVASAECETVRCEIFYSDPLSKSTKELHLSMLKWYPQPVTVTPGQETAASPADCLISRGSVKIPNYVHIRNTVSNTTDWYRVKYV